MRKMRLFIKRGFDIFAAALLLVILSPLLVLISLLILFSMGKPVIFKQSRLGFQGGVFKIYKFRTMTNAKDQNGKPLPDGERLTKIGRFLRSTTLDELPELLNVLKGEMSAVGPRPLLVEYRDLYTPEQWRRHEMPPGMAGPVLAGGRNTLTWEKKFQQDLYYVDNWSLWLDVKILFRTALSVIKREGINAAEGVPMPKFTGEKEPPEAG